MKSIKVKTPVINLGKRTFQLSKGSYNVVIRVDAHGCGTLESDLKDESILDDDDPAMRARRLAYNTAVDGLESLLLACACAGVDVNRPEYVQAFQTAMDAIADNYEE